MHPAHELATSQTIVVRSRKEILGYQTLLEELALRFSQPTAMQGLAYYFDRPENRKKRPCMVVVSSSPQHAERLDARHIIGVAIFYEYCVRGVGTKVFIGADWSGHRSLIAEHNQRSYVTSTANAELLRQGALFVLCTFQQALVSDADTVTFEDLSDAWAVRSREIPDHLPLLESYDATLATVGKRTRHHLRLFRKRIESHAVCEYVADVTPLIGLGELASLNASSINPISQDSFDLQWKSCMRLGGGYISGLRTVDGMWLSIVGGWRQSDTTVLQWQMNRAGFEKFSLSVAARSFLLEHEIALGQRVFRIEGGTPHSLANSFTKVRAIDLIQCRPSSPVLALMRAVARVWKKSRFREAENFLMDTLGDTELRWHRAAPLSWRKQRVTEALQIRTP
jgi:hypothetical protein